MAPVRDLFQGSGRPALHSDVHLIHSNFVAKSTYNHERPLCSGQQVTRMNKQQGTERLIRGLITSAVACGLCSIR